MDGAAAARRIRRRPGLPAVFASGYSDTAAIERVGRSRMIVLRKPFRAGELEAPVNEALAANRQQAQPPRFAADVKRR